MEFIEAPAFTRYLADYLDDDSYQELQSKLGVNPELGDLMPGTGGFRKLRWRDGGVAKAGEVACASSITTSSPITKYG